ncbi:MAG: shikimate kinase [Thermoplasmata archaeon]
MKGSARTTGAITIVNALPTGVGCAVGIELRAAAQVAVNRSTSSGPPILEIPPEARTSVVEESLRSGLTKYLPESGISVQLSLSSEIPVARGLKSSSAVSTAILLACARAAGRDPTALEIGLLSAEAGRRAGVSATGALDDALAGLEPGFVLTDNARGEIRGRAEVEPTWGVVLYVPAHAHPPSPNLLSAFSEEHAAGELVSRAANGGDWFTAMRLNTQLVERAMGYSYEGIRDRLRSHGALASGVSGLGPTLAAIAPTDRLAELIRALPSDDARKIVVPFTRTSSMRAPET